jgi:endoglucanase
MEGLATQGIDDILDIVSSLDINAIRVPLALDSWQENPGLDAECMPLFSTATEKYSRPKNYRELLSFIVTRAAAHNILILLDLHRLEANVWPTDGLWYSSKSSASDVLSFWRAVAVEHKSSWNVIGCDVFNEPYGSPTWNDWKSFVELVGNAVGEIAPSWLIFCEGVGNPAGLVKTLVFWGENLRPSYADPPKLRLQNKLVYSPHVYGMFCHGLSFRSPLLELIILC